MRFTHGTLTASLSHATLPPVFADGAWARPAFSREERGRRTFDPTGRAALYLVRTFTPVF